ncbi:steroid receptor-associated and regulated protein [Elephas maximus indicus]|uniref:steroid receptor-associated and regulated protein n=1 Tax=Elephas maximus indicus TaxID=99487 RepID=UPI0021160EDC|nr:steroid receptor-associated and regulated protein [Elephas maximus indicus]
MSLKPGLETSSGGKLVRHQKAIPTAHLTFIIDLTCRKRISLAAPPMQPQFPRPYRGPVTPSMKTHIVFCGENWPHLAQKAPLGKGCLAQARGTLPPHREIGAPASLPISSLCPQEAPEPKGSPLKAMPTRSSAWGTVKGSLKALSSCVCGQSD